MTAPAGTLSPMAMPSLERMMQSPFSAMQIFSSGTPTAAAVMACFFKCLYSPCTGKKYWGWARVSINFCSSWQAWPDTCTSYMDS